MSLNIQAHFETCQALKSSRVFNQQAPSPICMTSPFTSYFKALASLDVSEATEHTLRGTLESLLTALARDRNPDITIIHEPKRDRAGLGAPDFKVKLGEAILGYVETKPIGADLDAVLRSEQLAKYKQLSANLILTDYLEWLWLTDGHITRRERLCELGENRLDPARADAVAELIAGFLSTPPEQLGGADTLSAALAVRCHSLRDFLLEELERQDREQRQGRLYGLYDVFRRDVFHELELREFADAFAQTLGYGLFLAKLNAGERTAVTLANTKRYIPVNFALIRELVDFLDELEQDDYRGIRWLVEEILSMMNSLDLAAIVKDLAFGDASLSRPAPAEEDRLLFAKDPYVYFYEDFLKAYDRETRKARGVYYTPPPVVRFIVRAVHDLLQDTFGIGHGLADRKRVTVLDFATGTGTFLLEVLHHIFETVSRGVAGHIVKEHVLKNLYGFEYLIAPYTVAHLKLSQFLRDKGYAMQPDERLHIYLTNTLEPIQAQANFLLPALSREVKAAQQVKDSPILVITGNPPYSGHSRNTGAWITGLIDTYKQVDGTPLGERNTKWLQDDYVKFIRFAQWKMEQVEEGVVGIITNHSFLDNPTFRGMRQSLMQTFNRLYLLDLHGNAKKKETTPDGGKDENVFDIEQGVAISLLVRKKGLSPGVYHADLWGGRTGKYRALLEADKASVEWTALTPSPPFYLFIPQDEHLREEYERGWKVTDMFPVSSVGITTARDRLTIQYTEEDIWKTVQDFAALPVEEARRKYKLGKDARDWKVELAQQDLQQGGPSRAQVVPVLYRPFDIRYTYYTGRSRGFHCMPRGNVMRHMLADRNLALLSTRQVPVQGWQHVSVSHAISDDCTVSDKTRERSHVFPLYLYPQENVGVIFSRNVEIGRGWEHVHCSRLPINLHTVSLKEGNYLAPLYLYPQENVGIVTTRLTKDDWAAFATKHMIGHKSGSRYDSSSLFPLYLAPEEEKTEGGLFGAAGSFNDRRENFSQQFRAFIDGKYKCRYSPEAILGYIYAVLHSPTYRKKYQDFLKVDFPRVPFVTRRETFEALSQLGWELVQAHLLTAIPQGPKEEQVDVTAGDFRVEKPVYDPSNERLHINATQYFFPVPADVWAFHIGGYQVLGKYLKSRKGRTLSLDEIENVQHMVSVLRFTIDQMQRIEACWQPF